MKFRPGDIPKGDPTATAQDSPVEWADNALSNFMAWFSYRFLPTWCQTEMHWTSRVTQYLFTDCPCCMVFRGLTLGFMLGFLFGLAVALLLIAIISAAHA